VEDQIPPSSLYAAQHGEQEVLASSSAPGNRQTEALSGL